jgi:hypothetical protein
MTDFLKDPIFIAIGIAAVVGGIIFLFVKAGGGQGKQSIETVRCFVLARGKRIMERDARTFDGLVSYGNGGFVENAKCIIPLFHGRSYWRRKDNPLSARMRKPVYLTRPGDAAPLNPDVKDFRPDHIQMSEFEAFQSIVVERAVSKGKLEAGKQFLNEKLLAVAAFISILLAVSVWATVAVLPLTGLPVKSAESPQSPAAQATPRTGVSPDQFR